MTLYGATDPQVIGQPISPFFGAQQNVRYAGVPVIPQPPVVPGSGPQTTLLESVARGALPRNANASAIGGVSTGAQNPTPIDDLMGNGAGNQLNLGVSIPVDGGNPASITRVGINNQEFVDGIAETPAVLSTGPIPTNIETLTSAPVSGATIVGNVSLTGNFQG